LSWLRNFPGRLFLRINSVDSKEFTEDLAFYSQLKAEVGVIVPKTEPWQIKELKRVKRLVGRCDLILLIESFTAYESRTRLIDEVQPSGIGLGYQDMFAPLVWLTESAEISISTHIQLATLMSAKAAGIALYNSVSLAFKQTRQFKKYCEDSRNVGFDGIFSIHPLQVKIVNDVFKIDRAQTRWAHKVLKSVSSVGGGYTVIDGMAVGPPKVRRAQMILEADATAEVV
jgi:citrate lyase beta subunit